MNYTDIAAEIAAGKVRPIYLLHGEENYLIAKLEQQIISAVLSPAERDMNLIVFDGDPGIDELVTMVETVPFLGGKQIILIRGTKWFSAMRTSNNGDESDKSDKADQRLLSMLLDVPEYSHILFVAREKADKRRKIYKLFDKSGACVEINALKGKEVVPWIQLRLKELNKRLDDDALENLLAVVSMMQDISLGFLDQELEKLALYTEGRRVINQKDVEMLLSSIPEVSAFALTDCLSRKDVRKALALLDQQLVSGVFPLRILGMLAFEIRRLWQIRERITAGEGVREIADFLRVPAFIAEKMIRQSQNFSNAALKKAILALADADYKYKSSRADNSILGKIIIELCR